MNDTIHTDNDTQEDSEKNKEEGESEHQQDEQQPESVQKSVRYIYTKVLYVQIDLSLYNYVPNAIHSPLNHRCK